MKVSFTLRELKNAWRQSFAIWKNTPSKTNAHRLLLFYAAECGLKAVYLKNQSLDILSTETVKNQKIFSHNLNEIMQELRLSQSMYLNKKIDLKDITIKGRKENRSCGPENTNQVWRYGGELVNPTDCDMEAKLNNINIWIHGVLK